MPFLHKASSSRRIFGHSTAEFLRGPPRPVAWRLDVREDTNDRGMFLPDRSVRSQRGPSVRLASYISAGGMRDLRPGRQADINIERRQSVIRFALLLLALWLIFFFVPCG
ncbi:MAG: hypothetical protein WCI17_04440 [bacterium]